MSNIIARVKKKKIKKCNFFTSIKNKTRKFNHFVLFICLKKKKKN